MDTEKRWTLWRCPTCDQTETEPKARVELALEAGRKADAEAALREVEHDHEHTAERLRAARESEAQLEAALREAEEALEQFGPTSSDTHVADCAREALAALKRSRTTSTEGEKR